MQNCNFSDKFVSEAGLKILILSAGMDACHQFTLSKPSPRGINYSVDHNLGKKSIELIGEECGDSPKQVQRYIKITELIPEMLEKVDDGSMGFTPAVQLSFLKKKEQKEMLDAMEFAQCTLSLSQALRIKKLSADGKLTVRDMEDILSEIKQKEIDRVVFKTEQLHRFFPVSYTAEQMRREILEMLKLNMNKYWDE